MRKLIVLALLLLASAPLSATDIDRGVDLWRTLGNGTTFIDFDANPLPAGFFCEGSPAFTGKVVFEGVPLATDVRGGLRGADTVIERMDDASFNRRGVATVPIQVRALSLASVKPLATGCGLWTALVVLEGDQPTTRMRLVRTGSGEGYFQAPLALNARLTFVPLTGVGREPVSLLRSVEFTITPRIPWSIQPGAIDREIDYVRVDTDGDGEPDRMISGSGAFQAGLDGKTAALAALSSGQQVEYQQRCYVQQCHCDPRSSFVGGGTFSSASTAAAAPCAHLHCPVNATVCPVEDYQPIDGAN